MIETKQKELSKFQEKYGTAKDFYKENLSIRNGLEQEWRDASQLTLPYIFPVEEQSESAIMPSPFNSVGASGVNTLASKLLLALLPPTGVFFRLLPDKKVLEGVPPDGIKQLDSELAQVENDVVEYINQTAMRVPVYEAIKLLIVTGNTMLYKIPGGSFKVFSPYQYVVQRDYVGNMISACIKEQMSVDVLPESIIAEIDITTSEDSISSDSTSKQVNVYTMIVREGPNKYVVWQEVNEMVVEGSEKSYDQEGLPYLLLRWTTVNNEAYGRGLVEQYLGDLRSLEGLTQTIVEGAGISAMHLFGLRPGSTLKVEDLNNAENGAFVLGDLEREVSTLQVNKGADLQVPMQLMQQLEARVSRAFMNLGNGGIRNSERTTATEVRATAAELEATLGGVFSVLASEFQAPLIILILKELNPKVLKVAIPSVTTGISAISREKDFTNLNTMLQAISQLGPDIIGQYLNIPAYLGQIATSLGMSPSDIVKSPEQRQQEQDQAQQQQQQMMQQQQQGQMDLEAQKQQGSQ